MLACLEREMMSRALGSGKFKDSLLFEERGVLQTAVNAGQPAPLVLPLGEQSWPVLPGE